MMNLKDLQSVDKIDSFLAYASPQLKRMISGENPSRLNRVKLTVEFDADVKRYVMSAKDQERLKSYNVEFEEFERTAQAIEGDVRLRPFEYRQPAWRWLGIRFISLICLGAYLYAALLVL